MATGRSQALNLGGPPGPYGDSFVALDLMKGAEPWVYDTPNGQVTVPASALSLDARSWITDLPVINGAPTPVISNVFTAASCRRVSSSWNGRARARWRLTSPTR